MKTIFLIETHPVKKKYYTDVHCGFINTSKKISQAKQYENHEDAQNDLIYIVTNDFDSKKTLYLSIVKLTVKN